MILELELSYGLSSCLKLECNAFRVWDLVSGLQKSKLEGRASDMYSVAISPDSKSIVSGSDDSTVRCVRPPCLLQYVLILQCMGLV